MIFLSRRAFVAAPVAEAPRLLRRYFDEHADDGVLQFALRAPVRLPGLGAEIALRRDVIATIDMNSESDGRYAVQWKPADGGPFPRLQGVLSLDAEETGDACRLTIEGTYDAPDRGGSGEDAMLGHRIAQATARDLLARIGAELEATYRALEAGRAAARLRAVARSVP